MNVWLQKHDYSSEDLATGELEAAVKAFDSFDWQAEIDLEDDALSRGADCCPAGMGFVSDNQRILHLVPTKEAVTIHYMFTTTKRQFGLFKKENHEARMRENVSRADWLSLLQLHYAGNHQEILKILSN